MNPRAKRFANELFLPVEQRTEIVKFDAPENLEVVFEDAPQRVLNGEIRTLGFANFRPQQLVGRFNRVGRVLVELGDQPGLADYPKGLLIHRNVLPF